MRISDWSSDVCSSDLALIFEPDSPDGQAQRVSYRDLHARVCRLANALRNLGIAKGDRVTIYMPMIVDAAVAMLACARIGAVHNVVFGGFSAKDRKSVGQGRSVSVRLGPGGRRLIQKK